MKKNILKNLTFNRSIYLILKLNEYIYHFNYSYFFITPFRNINLFFEKSHPKNKNQKRNGNGIQTGIFAEL